MQFHSLIGAVILYGLLPLAIDTVSGQVPPGSVDKSFFIGMGADATVRAITPQSDGKILIGGLFTSYSGNPQLHLARINSNGSLDDGFDSPITELGANVLAIAIQTDGRILAGLSGASLDLLRMSSNGIPDATFISNIGTGPDGIVHAIVLQPDGKILIGGEFTHFNGNLRSRLVRLNTDGTLDPTFNPLAGPDYHVFAIALQTDGKILIGGQFQHYSGTQRSYIARISATGLLDPSFTPGLGASAPVQSMAIQPDARIIIAGSFGSYDSHPQNAVARLTTNGVYDATFGSVPELLDGTVFAFQIQRDGKTIVAGDMTTGHLLRLNTDGTKDLTYQPGLGPGDDVYAMAIQSDQRILIGGLFDTVDGSLLPHIARINTDLKLLAPNKVASQFSAQIQTIAGVSYELQYKASLEDPTWTTITESNVAGDGTIQPIVDSAAAGLHRFYRVIGAPD